MIDDTVGIPARATAMASDDGSANPAALVGHSIAGKFVIEALVATGGAGTVYRARQLALDRIVALKVLRQDIARDVHFIERFKREARAASRLDHPNSVRVFDFGWVDDSLPARSFLYLAMEFVEGRTLHQMIAQEWPLADARIVDIMSQVLSGVAVAHEMGVIHRDLKPDNIMIIRTTSDDGEDAELAKVCDFGIATLGAATRDGSGAQTAGPWATNDGTLVGTPGYMSPEQARGEPADRRSDIYSAGVILYHMLGGRPPFEGESAYFVAMKHITDAPVPPSSFATVNRELETVCLRALSKAPGDRFASAREMRAALRAALARSTPAGAMAAAIELTPRPQVASPDTLEMMKRVGVGAGARRRRAIGAMLGLTVVAIVAGAFAARSLFGPTQAPVKEPTAAAAVQAAVPTHETPPAPPTAVPSPAATPAAKPKSVAVAAARSTHAERPARARPTRDRGTARSASLEAERPSETVAATAPPTTMAVAAKLPPAPAVADRAAPAPVAVAPPPRIDIERATASITAVTTTSAIPGSNVRAALGRVPLARCYRDALRAGSMMSGVATLRLRIDATGYVTAATLQGTGVTPALKACIEKAATAVRIKDVDTGDATAEVMLSFVATP